MRALFFLICVGALSLTTPLQAQSGSIDLGLNLEPGNTYQLKIQKSTEYEKTPELLQEERKSRRNTPRYSQNTRTYDLTVLQQQEDKYQVQLVRTLLQSCTLFDRASNTISDYSTANETEAVKFRDTVRFEINRYGVITQLHMPDSTARGYVVADTFQVEMEPVMPSVLKEWLASLNYIPDHPVKIGDSWSATSGEKYTLIGKQAGHWHLKHPSGREIYLDPQTNWVNFGSEDQIAIRRLPQYVSSTFDYHQITIGKAGASTEPVRISGYAPLHKNNTLLLRLTPYFMGRAAEYPISVNAEGYFEWEAPLEEAVFFQLTDLYDHTFWGFTEPGSSLDLQWRTQGGWTARGSFQEECHYLNEFFSTFPKYELFLQYGGDRYFQGSYESDLEQFWKDRLKDTQTALTALSQWDVPLSPKFIALQERQIEYFRAAALSLNLSYHQVYLVRNTSGPDNLQPIPDYYQKYLDELVLYDEVSRSIPAFRALLHLDLQRHMFEATTGDLTRILSRPYESAYYYAQLYYQKYPLYQTTFDLLQMAMTWSRYPDRVEHLFRHFQEMFPNRKHTYELARQHRLMDNLRSAGEKVPNFIVYHENGSPTWLEEKKGIPSVLIVLHGPNYWRQSLEIERTAELFPEIQFRFLHIGQPDKHDPDLPESDNIHHLYAKTNSGAAARAFLQYSLGRHPRVYLINRKGKLTGTLQGNERYDTAVLPALKELQAGEPIIDEQTKQGMLLVFAGLLVGGLLIGLTIHQWQRRLRHREQFHRQQVEAQLQAIRSQLNPHFMFNSMNSIQHLIRSGQSDRAQSYLGKLANLLRASLRYTRENFISLQQELDIVGQYCELEALRFNFSYDLEIDKKLDTRSISVPPLLLQPYVENAVLHGIAALREKGKLHVNISEQGRRLWIRIRDNGPGVQATRSVSRKGNGLGLALNAERLRLVYGDTAQVNIYSPSPTNNKDLGSGTEVQIAMPIDV